jgi:hypothetical protein
VTFAVSAARWALVGTVQDPRFLVAQQVAHALTFGAFWGSALSWVGECVPPRLRATGQTLFTGVLYGVGNGLGHAGQRRALRRLPRRPGGVPGRRALELVPLVLVLSLGRRLDPLRRPGS